MAPHRRTSAKLALTACFEDVASAALLPAKPSEHSDRTSPPQTSCPREAGIHDTSPQLRRQRCPKPIHCRRFRRCRSQNRRARTHVSWIITFVMMTLVGMMGLSQKRRPIIDWARPQGGPALSAAPAERPWRVSPIKPREPKRAKNYQPACKPGSVWRLPSATAIHLGRALLRASSNQPGRLAWKHTWRHALASARPAAPIWFCSRWGLPCHDCCQPRGALLPHRFTLTSGTSPRRFVFCGTFPGVAPGGR